MKKSIQDRISQLLVLFVFCVMNINAVQHVHAQQGPPVLPTMVYPEFIGLPNFLDPRWITTQNSDMGYYSWDYNNIQFVTSDGPSIRAALMFPQRSRSQVYIYAPAHFKDGKALEHMLSFWYYYTDQPGNPVGDSFNVEVENFVVKNIPSSSKWKKMNIKVPAYTNMVKLGWVLNSGNVKDLTIHYAGLDAVQWIPIDPVVNFTNPDFNISYKGKGIMEIRWNQVKYESYELVMSNDINGPWKTFAHPEGSFGGIVTVTLSTTNSPMRFFRLMSP